MLLGMSLTTLSMPAFKLNGKLEQPTHLCHRSPFVTMVPEAHDPASPASVMPLTREDVPSGNAALYTDVPFARRCNEPVCTNDEWSCYTNTSKV